ncbi:MAG TPA: hypothetical protein VFQ40_04065 [Actinomycetota bacterium]|nr:hypothetical protein [Actinomycetota bacterium]
MADLPPAPRDPFPGVPTPRPARPTRPGMVTGAAAIMLVAGSLNLLIGVITLNDGATFVLPQGDVGRGPVATYLIVGGLLQLLAGWLILRLRPAGRILGVGLAALGIVAGLLQLGSAGVTGVLAMLLYAFVLYGLLAYSFVFEQAARAR